MNRKFGWIVGGTAAVALSVAAVTAMAQGWGNGPGWGPQGGWNQQQGGNWGPQGPGWGPQGGWGQPGPGWGPQGMNRPMMGMGGQGFGPGMQNGGQGFGPGMQRGGPGMMQGGPGMMQGGPGMMGGKAGGGMFAGKLARFCNTDEGMITGRMLDRMEGRLQVTTEQTTAWNALKDAVKAGEGKLRTACDGVGNASTAPERLAALETTLGAASDALKEVRPAAEAFYATLSDDQKQLVDQMGQGRHGGWKSHGMKHRQMGWGGQGFGPGMQQGPGMQPGQWGGRENCPMGGKRPWWNGNQPAAPGADAPAGGEPAPQAN